MDKIIKKKSIGRFSLKVSLNELNNNQSETKAKINSQIKLCPQKSLKTVLKSNALNGSLCFYQLTWSKNLTFVDHPKRSLMVQRLNVSLLSKESKDRLMVQCLKQILCG